MADYTPNLNLKKPGENDFYNIEDDNDNMDKIDAAVAAQAANYGRVQPATGTGTVIEIVLSSVEAYTDKSMFTFIASANNNGAATTINVNNLGSKPLYKPGTTTAPTLKAGKAYTVWYNLAGSCFFLKAGATGTATPAQVLDGVPFSNEDDTDLVGEMPNNSGDHACLSSSVSGTTLKLVAKEGYTDGIDDTVTITDADFGSANIRKDKEVFGLTGTAGQGPSSDGMTYSDNTNGVVTYTVLKYNVRATPDGKYFYVIEGTSLKKYDLEFNLVWSITAVWNGGTPSGNVGTLAVDQNGNVFVHVAGTMSVTKYSGVDGSIIQYGGVADYINIGGGASTLHCTLAGDKFVCDAYISGSRVLGYNYSTGVSLFSVTESNAAIFGIDKYGYFWTRNHSTANLKCRDINDGSTDYEVSPATEETYISMISPLGDAFIGYEFDSSPTIYAYHISAALTAIRRVLFNSAYSSTGTPEYAGFTYDGCSLILTSLHATWIYVADKDMNNYNGHPGVYVSLTTNLKSGTNYMFMGNNGCVYQFNLTTVKKISANFRWNG